MTATSTRITTRQAEEIKLRAERRAGEMLATTEKQKPGEYQRLHDGTVAPSLADLGVEKIQSHRWQQVAAIPEADFEQYVSGDDRGTGSTPDNAALNLRGRVRSGGGSGAILAAVGIDERTRHPPTPVPPGVAIGWDPKRHLSIPLSLRSASFRVFFTPNCARECAND